MGVSFFIARRLSLSSGGGHTSPAVRVAIAAVALSVVVMMGAIAIVIGFKEEITRKVAGFNPHIQLSAYNPTQFTEEGVTVKSDNYDNIVTLTPTLKSILNQTPGINDFALQASIPAILKTSDDFKGIYLKSLTGKSLTDFISSSLTQGSIPDYTSDSTVNSIIISKNTADQLNLKAGDPIDTYFISDQLRVRPLRVAAIFDSHFDSYDDNFGFGSLSLIQNLGQLSSAKGTSVSLTVDNLDNVDDIATDLSGRLIKAYSDGEIYRLYLTESVSKTGASYFQWLDMLDMNVIVVLILMTIVSCVTLCSGMLILMADKSRFIALMNALGAHKSQISRVFLLLATKITIYGLVIGDAVSVLILYMQSKYHFLPLDPDSYYIDFVPVRLSLFSFITLNLCVLVIIFCSLYIPAHFASKKAPARILAAD